jgi:5-methyltetrahydropteroyltriglutamate--homocysteine methyltransferase
MARREDVRTLRVDQVGSLLRPRALIEDFLAHGRGILSREALERRIDEAIRAVVATQEAMGFPVVTDGEYARISWQVSFASVRGWALDEISWRNFVANPEMRAPDERPNTRGRDAVESFKTPATERLRLAENVPLAEYRRLAAIATRPAKAMLMGPDRVAQMCDIVASKPHYGSADEFLADVVKIQGDMVGGLVDAGCPYVQLDEPSYTGYVDRATLERMRARGEDPLANLRRAIAASNAAIAAHRDRAVFGIHVCRGNRASLWHREGTYDGIAEELFGSLGFDRLLLEYDTARAGGFEPLRFVPRGGPVVVLGLVTTKTGEVETVDSLLRRIEDAQRFIPVDQLAISPQCGFASGMAGNDLSEDQQWRKLEVLLEAARRVWP